MTGGRGRYPAVPSEPTEFTRKGGRAALVFEPLAFAFLLVRGDGTRRGEAALVAVAAGSALELVLARPPLGLVAALVSLYGFLALAWAMAFEHRRAHPAAGRSWAGSHFEEPATGAARGTT